MNINLIIQDSISGKVFDISELVSNISWETQLTGQPGKFTFKYQNDDILTVNKGSVISFKVDTKGVFFGYVFKKTKNNDKSVSVTAYDQLRYLKNKDTYVFQGMTASQRFEKICKDCNLRYRITNSSSYVLSNRIEDSKSLFDMIDWGITETMAYTSNWYMIRDDFGTLDFVNLNSLKTDLFIGDKSLLTTYDHESSIDEDSYNQVKLVQENTTTKKRDVYIVKDSSNIKQWGLLQYFETVDANLNEAQIKERAEQLLKLKNRETQTLKVNCLGDLKVFAGSGVVVGISDLQNEGFAINKYYVVTHCTHNFDNNNHTMTLDLQVSI